MEKREFAARVEKGIIFLRSREGSEAYPELRGWPVRINRELLDLGSPRRCIVGQLLGEFRNGLLALGVGDLDQAEELGFYLYPGDSYYYDYLTEVWRERLALMPEVQAAEEEK